MNLHIPSVIPHIETKITTSATVRHSCEILEQSRKRSISDPADTPSEGSTTELENLKIVPETDKLVEMGKDSRKRSHHIERKPDIAAVVTLRRTHDKRLKDKVVDIPTMIAHLSARASMIIEDPSSSSSSDSNSESDDDSADSENFESQFLVNVSERANQFMKQEKTVQVTKKQHAQAPPPQRISLLPGEAVGRLKENRSVFEKKEPEKERKTSLFDDNTMDSVVLLMKSFLDENKPTGTSQSDKVEQDYLHHASGLIPGEREALLQEDSLNSGSDSASESQHHASGHYSLSPERPNSDFDHERTSCQSATSMDDKRASLKRGSSASGNEYGDEVPLSMI